MMPSVRVANAILDVEQVSKRFGGLIAVDALNFQVGRGELVGIIGPNGSGKTTMLNLISGALRPTSGRISLQGRLISTLPIEKIARLGIGRTFQLVRLLPELSVLENCTAGALFGHRATNVNDAERKARSLLERLGLADKQHHRVAALTYIDQKRLELARAMAGEPELLLLDEWLAGLNPTELDSGIELVRTLQNEGTTIVLVEHVMDAIRSLCDRCVVMASGAMIAHGTPEEVLNDPIVIKAYLGDAGGAEHA